MRLPGLNPITKNQSGGYMAGIFMDGTRSPRFQVYFQSGFHYLKVFLENVPL